MYLYIYMYTYIYIDLRQHTGVSDTHVYFHLYTFGHKFFRNVDINNNQNNNICIRALMYIKTHICTFTYTRADIQRKRERMSTCRDSDLLRCHINSKPFLVISTARSSHELRPPPLSYLKVHQCFEFMVWRCRGFFSRF